MPGLGGAVAVHIGRYKERPGKGTWKEIHLNIMWISHEMINTPGAEVADLSLPVVVSVHGLAPEHNNVCLQVW